MAASHTAGTLVKVKISGVFTLIPGLQNFDNDAPDKAEIDTTALDATARTSVGGTPDYGTWSGVVAYDPASSVHQYLKTRYDTTPSPTDDFEITMSDAGAAVVTFSGYIKKFAQSIGKDDFNKANFSVRQTTVSTVTP